MIRNRVFDYGVTVCRQVRLKSILLLQLVVVLVSSIDCAVIWFDVSPAIASHTRAFVDCSDITADIIANV
jgi:hypothetical protein